MKTLILGDIHGRTCWLDIIEKEHPDKVIFMGDYVSTHEGITSEQQIDNLEKILTYKESNMDNVILLRGNHDLQHLGYSWAGCCGYYHNVAKWMIEHKERFLSLTQWVYIQDDTVFSHAGISERFWQACDIGEPTFDNILKINEFPPSQLFAFTPYTFSDYYGDSITQPLTWIRPSTLIFCGVGECKIKQCVAHTRVVNPGNVITQKLLDELDILIKKENIKFDNIMDELWVCDCLPEKYMLIEDGNKLIKTFNIDKL